MKMINRDEIRPILEALEEAFGACEIDYYLIGAFARDIWYARAEKKFRTTKDVDFAILVGNHKQYEQVRSYLEEKKGYRSSSTNAFVVLAPDGTAVDLLPFGSIEIDDGVQLEGKGLTNIKVNGFMEVYEGGTEHIEVLEGHSFEVATLTAIVLLKLIAYDDRPEKRIKDAGDIANILMNYFELEAPMIYEYHNDLFAEDKPERELEEIASVVVGRELNKLLAGNQALFERTCHILETLTEKRENSEFVRQMVQETDTDVDRMTALLDCILIGLKDSSEDE
ncbi:MAG: hypothetical protein BGO69_09120 [Bacteroidetes bacterium 46-16]|nr:MAG: hypothetical protein BGO69_09120 [Bacteroidetes bacterium 46-16]